MKKYVLLGLICFFAFIPLLLGSHQALADSTLTATTTVSNVAEVKASRTIGVSALPGDSETIVIGSCTVTFTTVASSTTDDLNCGNGASIDRTLSTGDTLRTAAQVATQLSSLTFATSTGTHGALTVASAGSASTTFTTSATETSATAITFTDGTGGDIVSFSSTTGVVPVAQVVTFTPGSVESGVRFTITINSTNYVATSTDSTGKSIVDALDALLASDTAASCTDNDITITCTAINPGTAFTYSTDVTTVSTSSGEVHHGGGGGGGGSSSNNSHPSTPASDAGCINGAKFSVTTGGRCSASVTPDPGCVGGAMFSITTGAKCPVDTSDDETQFIFNTNLKFGMRSDDVRELQVRLTAEGVYSGPVTGYFGALTRAAVKAYQSKNGLPPVGMVGPMTRALLNQ